MTNGFGFFTGGATFTVTRTAITTGTYSGDTLADYSLTLDPATPLLIGTSDYGLSLTSGTVRMLSLTGGPVVLLGCHRLGHRRRAEPGHGLRGDRHRRFAGDQPLLERVPRAIDWSTVPGLSGGRCRATRRPRAARSRSRKGFGFFTGGATFSLTRTAITTGTFIGYTLSDFELTLDSTTPLLIGTSDYGLSLTSGTVRLLSLTEAGSTSYSGVVASGIGGALNLGHGLRGDRHGWLAGAQPLLDGHGRDRLVDRSRL